LKNFKIHFWEIGKISFPLTLATASATILIFIDSLFATRISIESYEAVFLTLPIMGIGTGIGIGLAAAIADLISKETDLSNIKRLIAASLVLSLLSICAFLYVAIFHVESIESVAGLTELDSDSLIPIEFRKYWQVVLWTFPMQILFALSIQYLTILKKQKAGIYIVLMLLVLNVILDYWFTQILPWGVEGLAYSTMGVFSAGVLVSILPLRKEEYFHWPYPSIYNKAFAVAFGKLSLTTFLIFLTIVIFSIAGIILNKMALRLSTAALVTYAVFRQIMEVIILATRGLSGGFIIYFGNAIRDKATAEYFPIYWAATAWIAVVNIIGCILMYFYPHALINLFDNIELSLYSDIVYILMLGVIILLIFIIPKMAQIGFISLNRPILLVLCSVVFVIVQVVTAYYWIQSYGVFGLAYAEIAACLSTLLIFFPLFVYHLRKSVSSS